MENNGTNTNQNHNGTNTNQNFNGTRRNDNIVYHPPPANVSTRLIAELKSLSVNDKMNNLSINMEKINHENFAKFWEALHRNATIPAAGNPPEVVGDGGGHLRPVIQDLRLNLPSNFESSQMHLNHTSHINNMPDNIPLMSTTDTNIPDRSQQLDEGAPSTDVVETVRKKRVYRKRGSHTSYSESVRNPNLPMDLSIQKNPFCQSPMVKSSLKRGLNSRRDEMNLTSVSSGKSNTPLAGSYQLRPPSVATSSGFPSFLSLEKTSISQGNVVKDNYSVLRPRQRLESESFPTVNPFVGNQSLQFNFNSASTSAATRFSAPLTSVPREIEPKLQNKVVAPSDYRPVNLQNSAQNNFNRPLSYFEGYNSEAPRNSTANVGSSELQCKSTSSPWNLIPAPIHNSLNFSNVSSDSAVSMAEGSPSPALINENIIVSHGNQILKSPCVEQLQNSSTKLESELNLPPIGFERWLRKSKIEDEKLREGTSLNSGSMDTSSPFCFTPQNFIPGFNGQPLRQFSSEITFPVAEDLASSSLLNNNNISMIKNYLLRSVGAENPQNLQAVEGYNFETPRTSSNMRPVGNLFASEPCAQSVIPGFNSLPLRQFSSMDRSRVREDVATSSLLNNNNISIFNNYLLRPADAKKPQNSQDVEARCSEMHQVFSNMRLPDYPINSQPFNQHCSGSSDISVPRNLPLSLNKPSRENFSLIPAGHFSGNTNLNTCNIFPHGNSSLIPVGVVASKNSTTGYNSEVGVDPNSNISKNKGRKRPQTKTVTRKRTPKKLLPKPTAGSHEVAQPGPSVQNTDNQRLMTFGSSSSDLESLSGNRLVIVNGNEDEDVDVETVEETTFDADASYFLPIKKRKF